VSEADVNDLIAAIAPNPSQEIAVDLERQTIMCGNRTYAFAIDPVSRNQLLNGWDDVDLTESRRDEIAAYRSKDKASRPWATPAA
jgi:3-isopropylmalate/(R)-2-methylmalate dehydratase small subunit